ncbi:MAG: GatB/YqeY domain-containing protein [Candidatus Paceibacterota bacterium]
MHEQLKSELKERMKARDTLRVTVIRGILSAFTNEAVTLKRKPDALLSDEEALTVIARAAKQRKDSIEQYEKGGRPELAEAEKEELQIIESYLPQMMSQDEIRPLAEKRKEELGVDDKSKAGMLMGALMKDLKGKADGTDVKAIVDELLS